MSAHAMWKGRKMEYGRSRFALIPILMLSTFWNICVAEALSNKPHPLFCAVGWHGEFTMIDPAIGEIPPKRTDLPAYLQALAWSPNGTLYAGRRNDLYTIDPWTGEFEHIISTRSDIRGMAFSGSGKLFVTSEHTTAQRLRTINLETGAHQEAGVLWGDGRSAQGLAFSPDGVLYAISPKVHVGTYELFIIDPDDAEMHLLGSFASSASVSQSIAFAPDGRLYAIGRDIFARLNPADGSIIGSPIALSGDYRGLAVVLTPKAVYYVDGDAPGANNGSSWHDAFNNLQNALTAAEPYTEIRVAQGIYKPDQGAGITPGDRTATFQLRNHVAIKGGYAGFGQPDPNARHTDKYISILSGDLNGNDSPDFANDSDNSFHVVTSSNTESTALLDSFTITCGNANGSYPHYRGGGIYNNNGNPEILNCTLTGNTAHDCGGGLYTFYGNPTLTNCNFSRNSALYGGGVFAGGSIGSGDPTLVKCTFSDNTAQGGAGMHLANGSATLTNCTFVANASIDIGGGFYTGTGITTLTNCIFVGNSAGQSGGGMDNAEDYSVTLTNCTFSGNSAPEGGGIRDHDWPCCGELILVNCILWDNTDSGGNDESAQLEAIAATINHSCIQGWTGIGGGTRNTGNNPLFIDADGGDYHLQPGSPCIDAGDNSAVPLGVTDDLDGKPRIIGGRIDMGAYEFRPPMIMYVDGDAPGANNGSSWHDAFNNLQDALAIAGSGDRIIVAQGTYRPDQGIGITLGDRFATFRLRSGVAIEGGYAGFAEPDPDARDVDAYPTILTGDLSGNDGPDFAGNAENTIHIITTDGTDATAILDGFIITAANADFPSPSGDANRGAAVFNHGGRPTIKNCTFIGNRAFESGGAMYNYYSSNPTLINCTFTANFATDHGGAIYNRTYSEPNIISCTFTQNKAARGGAIRNKTHGSPTITDCIFIDNRAHNTGGAIFNDNHCPAKISHCTFADNFAGTGAAIANMTHSKPNIAYCIFTGNSAGQDGGAISNDNHSRPTLTNSVFNDNSAGYNGGLAYNYNHSSITMTNCTAANNVALYGGGTYNRNYCTTTLTNCIFWANTSDGPEIYLDDKFSSVVVTYTLIRGQWPGPGNIYTKPHFVDYPAGNFRLKSNSACINAGDPDHIPEPNETDLDGRPRIIGGRVDMGAYEFNHIPIADAGDDRTAYAGLDGTAAVTLDGAGSYDEDGQPLTYSWTWTIDGTTITMGGPDGIINMREFAALAKTWPPKKGPTARTVGRKMRFSGLSVLTDLWLTTSASSSWNPKLDTASTDPTPTITLPIGVHVIELIVNDGLDDSAPDQVVITVIGPLQAELKITPRIINRRSHAKTISARISLPAGVTKDQINTDHPLTLRPGQIEPTNLHITQSHAGGSAHTTIIASFDKAALIQAIPQNGQTTLKISGKLKSGQHFGAAETITIIH